MHCYTLYQLPVSMRALPALTVPAWPGAPLTCPRDRTPSHSPGAISSCPSDATAGTSSISPQPCPPHPRSLPSWAPLKPPHPQGDARCPALGLSMVPPAPHWGGGTVSGCQALPGIILNSCPMGTSGPRWALAWRKNCRRKEEEEAAGEPRCSRVTLCCWQNLARSFLPTAIAPTPCCPILSLEGFPSRN